MLMNSKGGCGKTTLATNIATWFADEGARVAIADYDPQGSSLDWLAARRDYDGIPNIEGLDATKGAAHPARGTDFLIIDSPAAIHGAAISGSLRRVQTLIIPVLPSPFDIRACTRFLEELLTSGHVNRLGGGTWTHARCCDIACEVQMPGGRFRRFASFPRSATTERSGCMP